MHEDEQDEAPPQLRPHRSSLRRFPVSHPAQLDPETLHPAERRKLARAKKLLERADSDEPRKYSTTKLSVKNLPHGVTAEQLKEAFISKGLHARYARILAWPRSDGRFISRGYGWVAIDDGKRSEKETMEKVLAIDKFIVGNKMLEIEPMLQRLTGSFDRIDPPKPPPELRLPVPGQYASSPTRLLSAPRQSHRFKDSGLIPGQPFPADFDTVTDTGFGLKPIGAPESGPSAERVVKRDGRGVLRDEKGRYVPPRRKRKNAADELTGVDDFVEGDH